jgi:hypothetical protein
MKTKEQIYDECICELMERVIAICKEHKIALIADFALDEDLHCTTALLDAEYNPSASQLQALRALKPKPSVAFAETHETMPNGSKRISIRRIS